MQRSDKFLVVGTDGMIGRALADYLKDAGKTVLETTHQLGRLSKQRLFLDLTRNISDWQPPEAVTVAFICSAVTSLERCRVQPKQSALFNVYNTVTIAEKLAAKGVFIIFLSTSLVYDGSIPFRRGEEPVCPITEYGRQKAEAERALLAMGDSTTVVRFTKVLGPKTPLIKGWIEALQYKQIIYPFSDMVMSPVPLSFSIEILRRVAEARLYGIVQVSAKEDITYAQAAHHLARRIGANSDLVQPVLSTESSVNLETVPAFTTLDTTRLRLSFGLESPDVWTTFDTAFGLTCG
jgi:dTDP-4-dehydrorhamnose reductase